MQIFQRKERSCHFPGLERGSDFAVGVGGAGFRLGCASKQITGGEHTAGTAVCQQERLTGDGAGKEMCLGKWQGSDEQW